VCAGRASRSTVETIDPTRLLWREASISENNRHIYSDSSDTNPFLCSPPPQLRTSLSSSRDTHLHNLQLGNQLNPPCIRIPLPIPKKHVKAAISTDILPLQLSYTVDIFVLSLSLFWPMRSCRMYPASRRR